jgi:hypothetical protein
MPLAAWSNRQRQKRLCPQNLRPARIRQTPEADSSPKPSRYLPRKLRVIKIASHRLFDKAAFGHHAPLSGMGLLRDTGALTRNPSATLVVSKLWLAIPKAPFALA